MATGLDPHVLPLAFALFLATIAATFAYRTWRGGARLKQGRCKPGGWITIFGISVPVSRGFSESAGVRYAAAADDVLRIAAAGGAGSGAVPRFSSALIALLAYAEADRVDWVIGLPLALGGIAAASAGVKLASRLPERRKRWLSAVSC